MKPDGFRKITAVLESIEGIDRFNLSPKPIKGDDIRKINLTITPYEAKDIALGGLEIAGLMIQENQSIDPATSKPGSTVNPRLQWRGTSSEDDGSAHLYLVDANTDPDEDEWPQLR